MTSIQISNIIARTRLFGKANGAYKKGTSEMRYYASLDMTGKLRASKWLVILCEREPDKAPVYTYIRENDIVSLIRGLKGV